MYNIVQIFSTPNNIGQALYNTVQKYHTYN
nr:MAG TPA: hypothetical protein [Caudoviricetes sp.]